MKSNKMSFGMKKVIFQAYVESEAVITCIHTVLPWDYKTFFMLNSAEHEIFCLANKSKITNNCKFFLAKHSWVCKFLCLINMKMPTIVGIFIFISSEIFMLS